MTLVYTPPTDIAVGQLVTAELMTEEWVDNLAYLYNRDLLRTYVEASGTVAISATSEGASNVVITGGTVTYDGATPILIQFYAPRVSTDGSAVNVVLWDDTAGASLGLMSDGSADTRICNTFRRLTPAAGGRSYSIRVYRTGGSTVASSVLCGTGGAAARMPAFLRIKNDAA